MHQGILEITDQNLSKFCRIANHQNFFADHTCNIEDCRAKYRQCCSMCFNHQLHIRDADYDLRQIYSNQKILEIIQQTQMAYMDQYDEFLADYYYAQLINSSLSDKQQLYYIEKWLPSYRQAISQLSYSNYRTQLEAKNMSLDEFLYMQRGIFREPTQFIQESFQNLTNSIKYEQFRTQIIPSLKLDVLSDIMENILMTKKYHNKQFNKQQYNLIQESLDELFSRDPKLGSEIVRSSYEIYNEQNKNHQQEKICEEIMDLENKIKKDPNNDQLHLQIGIKLLQNNNVREAVNSIQKAFQINPQSIYLKKLGLIMQKDLDNQEEAINFYNQAINLGPRDEELYILKGNSLKALKKFEEEIKLYYDALDHSHNLNLYYLLCIFFFDLVGNALFQQLKYQEAIEVCERGIRQQKLFSQEGRNNQKDDGENENYRQLYIILVQSLVQTKQFENSKIFCNHAIKIYKNEYIFYKIKGICLLNLNEIEEAKISFQTAVDYNSSLKIEMLQIQGEFFYQQNNLELAQKFYKTLINEQPYNSGYQKQFVQILVNQEKYDEALKALKQAIKKIPNDKHLQQLVDKINYEKQSQKKSNKQKNQINQSDINKNNQNKSRKNKKNNQTDKYIDEEEQFDGKNKYKQQFEETPTPDGIVKSKYPKQGKIKKQYNINIGQFDKTQKLQPIEIPNLSNENKKQSYQQDHSSTNVLESIIQISEDVEQGHKKGKSNIGQFEETPTPGNYKHQIEEPNALDSEIQNYKQLCQQGTALLQQNKYSKALEKFEQALEIKPDLYQKTQSKEQILATIMGNNSLLEMCDIILQLQEIK